MNKIIYSNPKTTLIKSNILTNEVSFEEFTQNGGFVFAPFLSKQKIKYYTIKDDLSFSIDTHNNSFESSVKINNLGLEQYKETVSRAIDAIELGSFTKLVVSRQIELDGKINYYATFSDLVKKHINCFVYLLILDGVYYLGATPEVLIEKNQEKVLSDSLAGTLSKSDSTEKQNWTNKEKKEQSIVTQFIKKKFLNFCSDVTVSELTSLTSGNLVHLKQKISGKLKSSIDFFTLVDELHPTPAVCGVPKEKAVDWITENEGYDRRFYTGYLGFYSKEKANLYVNLRCMKGCEKSAILYVGGGIVAGSTIDKELKETEHKSEALLSSIRKLQTLLG